MRVSTKVALLAAVLCASCIPLPHRSFRTPLVHGRIVANGQPVADLPVRVVAAPTSPCNGKHRFEARTNANGEFAFCPMAELDMFVFIGMAHSTFRWTTCANVNGEWIILNESYRYTLADAGPREIERLDCELTEPGDRCRRDTDIDISREKLLAVLGTQRCAGI